MRCNISFRDAQRPTQAESAYPGNPPIPRTDEWLALASYPSLYQLNTRENHDEPRAAATFALEKHQAAAVLTYLCPGLRIFREGQFEGRIKKVPYILTGNQPSRRNRSCDFYARLLDGVHRPETRGGDWGLLEAALAWDGNWTCDCFVFCLVYAGYPTACCC